MDKQCITDLEESKLAMIFGAEDRARVLGEHIMMTFYGLYVKGYRGGIHDFYRAANGAVWMQFGEDADLYEIDIFNMNRFRGRLSAEALGIMVTLFGMSHLSGHLGKTPKRLEENWRRLMALVERHPERDLIRAAMD